MSIPANEVMQIRFRTVNGITIRYAESDGHQDSFILLTCPWPESLYAFLPIWQPLSEHSHLLAIDLSRLWPFRAQERPALASGDG